MKYIQLLLQAGCPGNGALGTASLHSTTDDPFKRALNGASYSMAGTNKWVKSVEDAIKEFVAREYPENDLAKDGLRNIPDLPDPRHFFSPKAKMAGLMEGEIENLLNW